MLVARLSGAMDGAGQSVHGRIYSGLAMSFSFPRSCVGMHITLTVFLVPTREHGNKEIIAKPDTPPRRGLRLTACAGAHPPVLIRSSRR